MLVCSTIQYQGVEACWWLRISAPGGKSYMAAFRRFYFSECCCSCPHYLFLTIFLLIAHLSINFSVSIWQPGLDPNNTLKL